MKSLHWVIIGIGITTGIWFLLGSIFSVAFFAWLIIVMLCLAIAAGAGFLTVKFLIPQRPGYSIHKAFLVPWITVLVLYFAISLFRHQPVDFVVSVPLLLVFSSIGGFVAYRAKINKQYKSL
jgi:hypothetical protein